MSHSNSWEAITDATSAGALRGAKNDNSAEVSPAHAAVTVSEQASWFGIGGLGIAALSLAQGVASAIHQTAVNVAEELAEMERLADQELEGEEEARRRREDTSSDDDDRGGKDSPMNTGTTGRTDRKSVTCASNAGAGKGVGASTLPLPWQVPSTDNCKRVRAKSDHGDDGLSLVEDEQLKAMIMALALTNSTFKEPFSGENTSTTKSSINDGDDDDEESYFTKERVELIERMLDLDKNFAKAHAGMCFHNATDEELFFRNYFYHCDEIRANYTIRDEELDINIVLQTPPPSPEQRDPSFPDLPAPRQLSIDDLVLVGFESDENP